VPPGKKTFAAVGDRAGVGGGDIRGGGGVSSPSPGAVSAAVPAGRQCGRRGGQWRGRRGGILIPFSPAPLSVSQTHAHFTASWGVWSLIYLFSLMLASVLVVFSGVALASSLLPGTVLAVTDSTPVVVSPSSGSFKRANDSPFAAPFPVTALAVTDLTSVFSGVASTSSIPAAALAVAAPTLVTVPPCNGGLSSVLTSHQGGGLGSAGVVAFEPLYRSAAVPFLSPALTSTKVFDHHPTPGLTVVGSPFELPSDSSRPVSNTPLPLCGFQRSGATCFFGGDPPTPTTSLFVPVVPPPSDDPARGLPFRPAPAVAAARPRWLHQIARLQSFPGVNLPRLTQTAAFITSGYKMDFKAGPPPPGQYRNTGTFRAHKTVCKERLRVYEDLGALRWLGAADTPPGGYPYVQPLHAVVKQGKKARVCVDLSRNVNDYVADEFIKFSSVRSAVQLSQQCPSRLKFYVKLDISACYLSFPLHPDDLPYYVSEVDGAFLQFLSVVFGHKAAPREVSYAMDIVSSALEEAGIAHERYLDDFFIVATSEARAWACAHKAAEIIRAFGLSLAPAKVEGPAPLLEYLGVIVDSVTETLAVSPARRTELLDLLRYFAGRSRASVHQIQSLIGKLSFASQVLPGSRPFLRRLIDLVRGPNGQRRLTSSVRSDLKYWTAHFDSWNGRARWRRDESDPFVFGSDASTTGFGYGLESCPARALASLPPGMQPGTVRMGSWAVSNGDAVRQSTSSTIQYGEAFCVLAAAVEYGSLLRDSHVVFVIDNAADVFVFNRLSTRDIAVGKLLRSLCDTALRISITSPSLPSTVTVRTTTFSTGPRDHLDTRARRRRRPMWPPQHALSRSRHVTLPFATLIHSHT
jgi:hypothetical protein